MTYRNVDGQRGLLDDVPDWPQEPMQWFAACRRPNLIHEFGRENRDHESGPVGYGVVKKTAADTVTQQESKDRDPDQNFTRMDRSR